ncbi:MAG: TonB-dependent receptor, partial [Dehalococcoidia bacterium]|nr:TonB-dependent receptor [Dehalococcoidia bacterium]
IDIILLTLAIVFSFIISGFTAWAQESETSEFTLEEITITAEKRSISLQELSASVIALEGGDLAQQGKLTTAQILEGVPNITYRSGSGTNPDGNIAIRGVQRTQESGGGNAILPAVTAVYVDGVYQGIGGGYDINRVEVLRGPQGTLYGRSATGGVISFITNDPKLSEFGGSASLELGSASLKNVQAAINVPAGSMFAIRVAGHYYSRDGYYDADGGKTSAKEGRVKALFQPNDTLSIIASISAAETKINGGGWQAFLEGPDKIDYKAKQTVLSEGAPNKYRQAALNVKYDFGTSTLTYIGGYHDFDHTGLGAEGGRGENLQRGVTEWPTDYYHSEELRWASDEDFQVEWATMLVGANYFKHRFENSVFSFQTKWTADPDLPPGDPRGYWAPIFGQILDGYIINYGIFTEETFKIQDNFRTTVGLRYDKTEIDQVEYFTQNSNITAVGNSLNPPEYVSICYNDVSNFNNFTYKLRFEYDMTEENMLYFLTATGFMPGYSAISPINTGPPEFKQSFQTLKHEQQKLTSYEFGSKNSFMDDRFRLNADIYYYKYDGYPEAISLQKGGGPRSFSIIAAELKMLGFEVESELLVTMYDKISLSAGYGSTKITGFNPETITWTDGTVTDTSEAAMLEQLPGNPKSKATMDYEHTFMFANGSSIVPRAEVLYTGGHYIQQMTYYQVVTAPQKKYNYQDAYMLVNLGLTWNSPDSRYSVSGHVRNALDKEYKASVQLSTTATADGDRIVDSTGADAVSVTPGDPRTFGVSLNIKF